MIGHPQSPYDEEQVAPPTLVLSCGHSLGENENSMSKPLQPGNVGLVKDRSASEILHTALHEGVRATGLAAAELGLPVEPAEFRKTYAEVLPHFEAARLSHHNRHLIANHIVAALQNQIVWQEAGSKVPIAAALEVQAEPLPVEMHSRGKAGVWQPRLHYGGKEWSGATLDVLGRLLVEREVISAAAGEALVYVKNHMLDRGSLSLRGRRIAMLGAGAEMAPTRHWLEAGADVLWLDAAEPPESLRTASGVSGRLFVPERPANLLSRPAEVLATLKAWSNGEPLDLGLYAYAPGQAREMRLTGVMNALVDVMPRELIRTVTLLVSPTTPTALTAEEVSAMQIRLRTRPVWQKLLAFSGVLSRAQGCAQRGDVAVSSTVVDIQGASYQAAQYVGKVLTAECWYRRSLEANPAREGFRVSANSAAVTRTRSLEHPVFAAAFIGTSAFAVETLEPEQSRALNGLLAVHDWLHPDVPVPGKIRVHGGAHVLPYPLKSALMVAAAIGFARSPRLLAGLLKG